MAESMGRTAMGGTDESLRTEPLRPEASLGDLFAEMTSEFSRLMRSEVELAKTEAREEVGRAKKAGAMLGAAALAGWMALIFLSFTLAWLLDKAMDIVLAFLIVGLLWGVVALVTMSKGKKNMKDLQVLPETKETLKEDVQWAKAQKN